MKSIIENNPTTFLLNLQAALNEGFSLNYNNTYGRCYRNNGYVSLSVYPDVAESSSLLNLPIGKRSVLIEENNDDDFILKFAFYVKNGYEMDEGTAQFFTMQPRKVKMVKKPVEGDEGLTDEDVQAMDYYALKETTKRIGAKAAKDVAGMKFNILKRLNEMRVQPSNNT